MASRLCSMPDKVRSARMLKAELEFTQVVVERLRPQWSSLQLRLELAQFRLSHVLFRGARASTPSIDAWRPRKPTIPPGGLMSRMNSVFWGICILSLMVASDAWSLGSYVPRIPTSYSCGTCHFNENGGGARNLFGRAFVNNGRSWANGLCELDSDGDGVSNGAELGDPDCEWRRGDALPNGPTSRPGDAEDTIDVPDCNGELGGAAFVDECGVCVGGNTGLFACVEDCNGDFGGNAVVDECDLCVGGNTGRMACVQDCADVFGGDAVVDECGVCVGGDTGREACVRDCNGDFGGNAVVDECDVCVGGNTGRDACGAAALRSSVGLPSLMV